MHSSASNPQRSTSTSLLQRACENDELAWERLCRLFGPTVYRYARQMKLQKEDAADIVQEVFTTITQRLHSFDRTRPDSTFRGWLYVITRNKVRDRARALTRRLKTVPATDAKVDLELHAEESPSECDDPTETRRIAQRAMQLIQVEFEYRTWRAFHRVAVDGAPAGDVAVELSMSVGSVYKAKSRVMIRLRLELDGLI